ASALRRSTNRPSRNASAPSDWQPNSKRSESNRRSNMDCPSYHAKRRCGMTPVIQRIVIALAVLTWLGLTSSLPCAAETSQVDSATKQVGSGAKQVGRGVEDTAKGVGKTVAEGAKVASEKVQEAGKTAQPQVEDALNKAKDGAESAGTSVKNFFNKLFG